MQQSSFHNANMLAEQLQISINNQAEQRDQKLTESMHNVINQVSHYQEPLQHAVNATSQDHVQLETLKLLKEIRTDMSNSTRVCTPTTNTNPKETPTLSKNRIQVKPGFKTPDDFKGRR